MDNLRNWYWEGFSARMDALSATKKDLEANSPEAIATVRRITHSLRTSSRIYGLTDIAEEATAVEEADDEHIATRLDRFLNRFREHFPEQEFERLGVLVIDDDLVTTSVLSQRLSAPNRQIHVASSAEEAEKILADTKISLILLDLKLPDTDGRNLLVRLRSRPDCSLIPIIVVSGKGSPQTKTECFALGADAYFEKPFEPDMLSAAVAAKIQQSAELARQSRQDSLTSLPNRVAFYEAYARASMQSFRTEQPFSLAIIDIDRFKAINDIYGHEAGDAALRKVSQLIAQNLRLSDFLARWGGEEFVVFFPNTALAKAHLAVKKALTAVRKSIFEGDNGRTFHVSFSAGVIQISEDMSADKAVAEADHYLYMAKSAGRSRVLSEAADVKRPKKKILLVEDDRFIATVIKDRLILEGFEIIHSSDGDKALAYANDPSISLIILDLKLPGMDGFEVIERFRKIPTLVQVPILILSALGNESDIVRGFELGADDYMLKPFSPVELAARVHRFLKKD
jgi:diguanylate cyclase (GGDEF)-like protein